MDLNDVFTLAASLKAQDSERAEKSRSLFPSGEVVEFDESKKTRLAVLKNRKERSICNKTNGSTIGDLAWHQPRRMGW